MNLEKFLEDASYQTDRIESIEEMYRVTMNNGVHDLWFIYNISVNKIVRYECYNSLTDSSVVFDKEELEQIEKWFRKPKY